MLTHRARQTRQRRQLSLRQEYEEFVLQRIEEFKDQLSRDELLAIADEAVRELEVGPEEQLVLTEVLVLEHVDRLIMRRLNLPSFRRWRGRHVKLREAQREPTHWNIDPKAPVARLGRSLDVDGEALVVGGGATDVALYLAAHDWTVVFVDHEIQSVEALETRVAAEALTRDFQGLVLALGGWFPDVTPALSVLDGRTLSRLPDHECESFLGTLCARTPQGGIHCVLPSVGDDELQRVIDAARACYDEWETAGIDDRRTNEWIVARRL